MPDLRSRLQSTFMDAATSRHAPVSIYLANGIRIRGVMVGEDAYCLLLVDQGRVQLVYKHAVTSVMPERPLDLTQESA